MSTLYLKIHWSRFLLIFLTLLKQDGNKKHFTVTNISHTFILYNNQCQSKWVIIHDAGDRVLDLCSRLFHSEGNSDKGLYDNNVNHLPAFQQPHSVSRSLKWDSSCDEEPQTVFHLLPLSRRQWRGQSQTPLFGFQNSVIEYLNKFNY